MPDTASSAPVSNLAARLASGRFAVTAEISPPVSTDPTDFLTRAKALKGLATAVNVTDGAGAKSHLSTLVAAHFMVDAGVEPILQITCRDRNRIAIQADLIGAMAMGIHNVLVLTGDDPKAGDQPDTKPVFDLKSKDVLLTAAKMRTEHQLPTGTEIKGPIGLFLGGADMPTDPKPDWQPKSLVEKIESGADFAQTQFCMDVEMVRRYAARLMELGVAQRVKILIGVCPIPSARSARWMKEKLFGTVIPDAMIERIEAAADQRAEGKKACIELMQQLAEIPGIAGAHVMAPVNPSVIPEVISESGLV